MIQPVLGANIVEWMVHLHLTVKLAVLGAAFVVAIVVSVRIGARRRRR